MKRGARRLIFLAATIIFLISSYGAVMYAQGYKYDFSEGRFFITGAISIKTNTSATVYIDGKKIDSTSLLTNGLGEDGLLPGRHEILIQKEGHHSWSKTINIDEGSVLNFPKIFLFPENIEALSQDIESELLKDKSNLKESYSLKDGNLYYLNNNKYNLIASGVKGVSLSEDQKKLAWWNTNEIYVLWLDNASSQPFQPKGTLNFITRLGYIIEDITWYKAEDYLIIKSENSTRIIEVDTRGGINSINL